jgi:CubicO group peptidase (beta-lactamase class C family)
MKKIVTLLVFGLILLLNTNVVFGNYKINNNPLINFNDIDDYILNDMEINHIPGLSASIVINDTVMWKNSYGFANIEENKKVENETLFKIGSVSKTVTATALMQLYEQDYFELYDPINDYLPFDVIHPMHPTKDITFHNLLTHSSGIADNWNYLFHFVGDAPIPFQFFLEEYLVPDGEYYDEINNFHTWEPGSNWAYTNIGVALVGFLVEFISQESFTEYCENHLFDLLDMDESGWYLRDLNTSNIAMPYHWNGNEHEPYGHIGWVDVPAGDLRTSPSQLVNFLTMYIQNGSYNSKEILNSETVDLILSPQLPFNEDLGLIWWKSIIDGRTVWGHGGSDYGARAQMHFEPKTKIGVVVFINGESSIHQIVNNLFDYAETFLENSPPESPDITGPNKGRADIIYDFNFVSNDPDGDNIWYYISWGDGDTEEWIGPYASGEEINFSHSWSEDGRYFIKSKAKDEKNQQSCWKTIVIDIPKLRTRYNTFLYIITHRFPIICILFGLNNNLRIYDYLNANSKNYLY